MENLAGPWTVSGLAEGRLSYPTPESFKMSWVAAADFGRVADKALQGQLPNEVIALGGPAALDGTDLAQIMGETLGLDLTFDTMLASNFEAQLGALAGPEVAGMIGGLYGGIQANPDQFQPGFLTDAVAIEERFGLELTSLAHWASQHRAFFSN